MINLYNYGFIPTMINDETNDIPARVTAVFKERNELICEHGQIFGRLKSSTYFNNGVEEHPTTGDFVLIRYNDSGDSFIVKTLERKSKFARNDFSGHSEGYVKTIIEQVVAANFDYVFIIVSLNFDFSLKRIERYLTLSWKSGAVPVIILTKADLVEDYEQKVREVEKVALGVGVYAVSAKTGYGLAELSEYLKPRKTIVFLGSSGVGKSSLVNALSGENIMDVKEIREDDSRGRHTTTHRQLIMLSSGVMIIDTPGMRELGMWEAEEGFSNAFNDVEKFMGKCKFTNCNHQSEPGCRIKEALASGELSQERWNSYLQLKDEARFADDKAKFLRDKEQWHKSISKTIKQIKKKR